MRVSLSFVKLISESYEQTAGIEFVFVNILDCVIGISDRHIGIELVVRCVAKDIIELQMYIPVLNILSKSELRIDAIAIVTIPKEEFGIVEHLSRQSPSARQGDNRTQSDVVIPTPSIGSTIREYSSVPKDIGGKRHRKEVIAVNQLGIKVRDMVL